MNVLFFEVVPVDPHGTHDNSTAEYGKFGPNNVHTKM